MLPLLKRALLNTLGGFLEKRGLNLAELCDLRQNNISMFNISLGALPDTEY